jgi:predicted kinase
MIDPGGAGPRAAGAPRLGAGALVVEHDPPLLARLRGLADRRLVFFAGLPGTGKSLLTHQLAHLAHARGRTVHLLQWDVARPAVQRCPAGARYPERDGVTHGVIRMAVGHWARGALARWAARHPGPEHLLIGEAPLVGHRLVELVRPADDAAEPLLASAACRFALPVPSPAVRACLEGERARRAVRPLHAREREDAPPHVLAALWDALAEAARALGLGAPGMTAGAYDPETYRRVYAHVLRHRHVDVVPLEVILPTAGLSVYDFAVGPRELVPTAAEAVRAVQAVEARYPEAAGLERALASWWAG